MDQRPIHATPNHFHHYLYGNTVTVFTDHTAVKAVLETSNPSAKHARWWSRVYGRGVKEVKIAQGVRIEMLHTHPQLPAPIVGIAQDEVQVFPVTVEEGKSEVTPSWLEQEVAEVGSQVNFNTLSAGGIYIRSRAPFPSPREAYIYARAFSHSPFVTVVFKHRICSVSCF